jgi:5,10-methylene-tetrahydrofolate dehydrogenase/methenyl tetrahydrofolate cyclohydrolase
VSSKIKSTTVTLKITKNEDYEGLVSVIAVMDQQRIEVIASHISHGIMKAIKELGLDDLKGRGE